MKTVSYKTPWNALSIDKKTDEISLPDNKYGRYRTIQKNTKEKYEI